VTAQRAGWSLNLQKSSEDKATQYKKIYSAALQPWFYLGFVFYK